MPVDWQKTSTIVGLAGGLLGIAAACGGGIALVFSYFATQQQLKIVDCYQYYSSESLSAQTKQINLIPEYEKFVQEAAVAELNHKAKPTDASLLAAYKEAVRLQDEKLADLNKAQDESQNALKEQDKCGHQGLA